jgi:hypothetical protein
MLASAPFAAKILAPVGESKVSGERRQAEDMFGFERNKEPERYYLLAGMGGKAARRKHRWMMRWAIFIGLIASVVLGALMYYLHQFGK